MGIKANVSKSKKKRGIPFTLRKIGVSDMAYKMVDPTFYPETEIQVNITVSLDDDDYYFEGKDEDKETWDNKIHLTPAGFVEVMRVLADEIGIPMWELDIQLSEKKAKIIKGGK